MKRMMISALAAIAVTMAGLAPAPALSADKNQEALGVLLGAAAIGLLINEISKDDDRKKASKSGAAQTRRLDDWKTETHRDGWRRKYHPRTIPAACVFPVSGRDVVSARCMEEFGVRSRLPDKCGFRIGTRWGKRTVYDTRCLRHYGFRFDRHDRHRHERHGHHRHGHDRDD